ESSPQSGHLSLTMWNFSLNHQEVDVGIRSGIAAGVGAEQNHPLRARLAHQDVDRQPDFLLGYHRCLASMMALSPTRLLHSVAEPDAVGPVGPGQALLNGNPADAKHGDGIRRGRSRGRNESMEERAVFKSAS